MRRAQSSEIFRCEFIGGTSQDQILLTLTGTGCYSCSIYTRWHSDSKTHGTGVRRLCRVATTALATTAAFALIVLPIRLRFAC